MIRTAAVLGLAWLTGSVIAAGLLGAFIHHARVLAARRDWRTHRTT